MLDQKILESFSKNLRRLVDDAWSICGDYASRSWWAEESDEQLIYLEDRLAYSLDTIVLHSKFGLELLGLQSGRAEFLKTYESEFGKKPTALAMTPFSDEPICPALQFLTQRLSCFEALSSAPGKKEEEESKRGLLKRILQNTAKIISDRQLDPSDENQIRDEVFNVLIHPFPDAVRDIGIAKTFQLFRPDIGIKCLGTGIEYKFADNPDEVKRAVRGIYEDISGYNGSNDWTNFFSVIYLTDAFITEAQLQAEFRLSEVQDKWVPLLVVGRGGRKPKKVTKKGSSAPVSDQQLKKQSNR